MRVTDPSLICHLMTPEILAWCRANDVCLSDIQALDIQAGKTHVIYRSEHEPI